MTAISDEVNNILDPNFVLYSKLFLKDLDLFASIFIYSNYGFDTFFNHRF